MIALASRTRVDDRGVIELIADDDVLLGRAAWPGTASLAFQALTKLSEAGGADQPGAGGLERAVHGEGAADEPHRGGAGAEAVERGLARRDHLGLVAQSPR